MCQTFSKTFCNLGGHGGQRYMSIPSAPISWCCKPSFNFLGRTVWICVKRNVLLCCWLMMILFVSQQIDIFRNRYLSYLQDDFICFFTLVSLSLLNQTLDIQIRRIPESASTKSSLSFCLLINRQFHIHLLCKSTEKIVKIQRFSYV